MNLQEIAALIRRHLVAVLVILLGTAGTAYYLKGSTQSYQASATVVFTSPTSSILPNPYTSFGNTLIDTAGLMAIMVMSPQGQREVRAAGGTAGYDVGLVNSYNLEYPDFSDPDLIVTTASVDPAAASQTFTVVARILARDLAEQQSQERVPKVNFITEHVLGESGPLAQQGSSKRVYAGLLVLATVAFFALVSFLDRRSFRLGRRREWRMPTPRRYATEKLRRYAPEE